MPDDQGGAVRFYDVPELIRFASPVYVKLGVRNAPNIYRTGRQMEATAVAAGIKRVSRCALVLRMLEQFDPELAATVGSHRVTTSPFRYRETPCLLTISRKAVPYAARRSTDLARPD